MCASVFLCLPSHFEAVKILRFSTTISLMVEKWTYSLMGGVLGVKSKNSIFINM